MAVGTRTNDTIPQVIDAEARWHTRQGSHRRPRRRRLGDMFCVLGGANLNVLREVPDDRSFYFRLGMALIVPFTLGSAGVTAFAHIVTGRPALDPVLTSAGVVWGALVVIVERLLLTPRIDLSETPARRWRTAGVSAGLFVARAGLAVTTAVVVSEPLLTVLFADEIEDTARTEHADDRDRRIRRVQSDAAQAREDVDTDPAVEQERTRLDTQIEQLQASIADDRIKEEEARDQCNAEAGGQNGGDPGFGDQAEGLCALAEQAAERIAANEEQVAALSTQRSGLGADRIAEITAAEQADIARLRAERFDLDGYGLWARIDLTHHAVGWWWRLALSAGMVLIDVLAVLYKGLSGRKAHDVVMESRGWQVTAQARANAEWSRANANHHQHVRELEEIELAAKRRILDLTVASHVDEAVAAAEVRAEETRERLAARAERQAAGEELGDPSTETSYYFYGLGSHVPRLLPDHGAPEPGPPTTAGPASPTGPAGPRPRPAPGPEPSGAGANGSDGRPVTSPDDWEQIAVQGEYIRVSPDAVSGRVGDVAKGRPVVPQPGRPWASDWVAVKRARSGMASALVAEIENYEMLEDCPVIPRLLLAEKRPEPVLVIEWFERRSLDRWLFGSGRARIDVPVWLVLAYAHNLLDNHAELWRRGFAHGDPKLSNLLVFGPDGDGIGFVHTYARRRAGWLLLGDHGTVGPLGEGAGAVTPAFRPPEWTEAKRGAWPMTMLTDVYSGLGCTLWEIATGGAEIPVLTPEATLYPVNGVPGCEHVPHPLANLIAGFMSPDPDWRVSTRDATRLNREGLIAALERDIDYASQECARLGVLDLLVLTAGQPVRDVVGEGRWEPRW